MGRRSRIEGTLSAWLAAALLLPLASCAELNTLVDVAFPQTVPGLPADQPWVSLPVRRWLTETAIEPVAISACIAETCREPSVAGLFRARGHQAAALRRAAGDPAALVAALTARRDADRRTTAASRKGTQPARITAERANEGGPAGFVVRLSRPDGSRAAAGYAAAIEGAGRTDLLVIVAGSEGGARELARRIVPRLGG
jgi:hypothetical protein